MVKTNKSTTKVSGPTPRGRRNQSVSGQKQQKIMKKTPRAQPKQSRGSIFNGRGDSNRPGDGAILSNIEFVQDIQPSTTFVATSLEVNPGNPSVFTWLATQAINWEKYQFEELEFIYKPYVSEFNDNAGGVVILQFDYDAGDATPTNFQQMFASRPNVSDIACREIHLRLDPKEMHRGLAKYVRPGPLPPRQDIKTFDVGRLNIATQGQANTTSAIGQLHVKYRVQLRVPQLDSTGPPDPRDVSLLYGLVLGSEAASGVEDVAFWRGIQAFNYIPVVPAVVNFDGSYSQINLPPGFYVATMTGNFTAPGTDYFDDCFLACRLNGVEVTPGDPYKPGFYNQGGTQPTVESLTATFPLAINSPGDEIIFYRQAQTHSGDPYTFYPTVSIVAF